MENEAVAVDPHQFSLSVTRDPKAVLADAHRAAKALQDVIRAIPDKKKVMINGEQYLELEHWQVIGTFYKCAARVTSTEPIQFGEVRGFLAKADLINVETGQVISSAEAMCLNDEEKWSTRSNYEWKNGKKEKVGEVAVPLFQLRSMAQTRACSKVHRNVFSWVAVLAGCAPTPAEDMTGDGPSDKPKAEPIKPPEGKAVAPTETAQNMGGTATFIPAAISRKSGTSSRGAFTKYGVKSPDNEWYGTFDDTLGQLAEQAKEGKKAVVVGFKIEGEYKNIVTLNLA